MMGYERLLHQFLLSTLFLLGSYKFSFIFLQKKEPPPPGKRILSKPGRQLKPLSSFFDLNTCVFCCCCCCCKEKEWIRTKWTFFSSGSGPYFHTSIFRILYSISITTFYVSCRFSQNKNAIKFHNDWLLTKSTPRDLHKTPPRKKEKNPPVNTKKFNFCAQKCCKSQKPNSWSYFVTVATHNQTQITLWILTPAPKSGQFVPWVWQIPKTQPSLWLATLAHLRPQV